MIKEALDEKYSYQIDEYDMVHLFRGEDCQHDSMVVVFYGKELKNERINKRTN